MEIRDVRLEQHDRRDWSTLADERWANADSLYEHLVTNTNFVEAAEVVRWDELLADGAAVMDVGCGSGWLAGRLSARGAVASVVALDASLRLLRDVLPRMVERVGGDLGKIEAVCGGFTPLPLRDASVDAVVMSSAFHHAERPAELLRECTRVLAPGGFVAILNEVPYGVRAFLRYVATTAVAASVNAVSTRVTLRKGGHVAADHVLYDEQLGDRAMTLPQWRRLLGACGFSFQIVDSGLPSYKPTFRPRERGERNLTHFICRPT